MAQSINDNFLNKSPKDLNDKTGVFENGAWRAWNSISEAVNSPKLLPAYRNVGLTIYINVSGVLTEYWWRDGTANNQLIVKIPVFPETPDATNVVKGKLKLAGDLGGTADLPTVPALTLKANISGQTFTGNISAPNLSGNNTGDQNLSGYEVLTNKSISPSLGNSNTLYPSQGAVKAYADTKLALTGGTLTGPLIGTTISAGSLKARTAGVDVTNMGSYTDGSGTYWGALDLYYRPNGGGVFSTKIEALGLTANRSLAVPDASGTIALTSQLASYQLLSQKGNANGYAPLDGSNKIPLAFLPAGFQTYKGTWSASTNTPTLVNGTGSAGDTYRVTVAGSQDFGAGSIAFIVGDDVIYNGTIWQRNPSVGGITLGTANGLSLIGQELSLALSSTSTVGALSSTDWNTFNNKQAAGSYELTTNKGIAGGYASLDSLVKIPVSQIHEPTSSAILLATSVVTTTLGSKNVLSNIIDQYTGEYLTFSTTSEISTDIEVDGVIYIKYNGDYYKRDYFGALNVKWFGAIADASSDNTSAIQNAINILGAKGGTILFAPGDYAISGTITINKNITLLGDGLSNAQHTNACVRLLHFPISSGTDLFVTGLSQPGYGQIGGISIINFTIKGSSNSRYCFNFNKAAGMLIKQIYTDTFVDALVLEFALNSRIEQCNFAVNTNSCVRFTGIPVSTTITFSECYFHFSKWAVIAEHNTCLGITFDKCIVESCDEGGYDIHTDNIITVSIPYAENIPTAPTANVPVFQVGVNGIELNPGYPTAVLTIIGGNSAGCNFGLDPDSILIKLDKVQNVTIVGAILQRTTNLIETTANTKMVTFYGCTTFEVTNMFNRIFDRSKVVFSNYSNNNDIFLLLETPELKFIGDEGGSTSLRPLSTTNTNTILFPDASGTVAFESDIDELDLQQITTVGNITDLSIIVKSVTVDQDQGIFLGSNFQLKYDPGLSGLNLLKIGVQDGVIFIKDSNRHIGIQNTSPTVELDVVGQIKASLPPTDPTGVVRLTDLSTYAPLASPAFTGTPTVPTASTGTNTTQAASTAFVLANTVNMTGNQTGITGNKTFTNDITANAVFQTSDIRQKEVVEAQFDVSFLEAITYKWKDVRDNKTHIGYSAQEVEKMMPDAVNTDESGHLSVNYIEVLVAKINALEKRVKELEGLS